MAHGVQAMRCVILGDRSDIARQMMPMLEKDGWEVQGWHRNQGHGPLSIFDIGMPKWDLCLIPLGRVAPVGFWADQDQDDWEAAIYSNVLLPIRLLRELWPDHNPGASICFFAGANPNKPMENYSAYSVGKMALLKACEHLDLESTDAKFFALAPGVVLTKIHQATIEAGARNEVLERAQKTGGVPIERIYECLKWCIAQPKEVVGGRNICVSDKPDSMLAHLLKVRPNMYKLRRNEGS
jgi:NAD(P)-dependent dehydrogenase (short-subunit alcohol dehydrogenase family)